MNTRKLKQKRKECVSHRQVQFDKALDGLIDGKLPPEYVHERYLKLKEIKSK